MRSGSFARWRNTAPLQAELGYAPLTWAVSMRITNSLIMFEALDSSNRLDDLADVAKEAWGRGEAWRSAIRAGMGYMPRKEKAAIVAPFRDLGINHEVEAD